jgi:hypothetical protein
VKVILLALFIGWTLISIKGMLKKRVTNLQDEAEKQGVDVKKVQSTWKFSGLLLIFIVSGIYVLVSVFINTPYVIIGSAISIVFYMFGCGKAYAQIDKGEVISGPSFSGLYSVIFKSYIVYELVRSVVLGVQP